LWALCTVAGSAVGIIDKSQKTAGIIFDLVDETKTPRDGPYSYYAGYYYKKYYQG
jgi:hypothetical protein